MKLTERFVAEIAKAAEADERSVWKRLAGAAVRGRVQARIDRALKAAGVSDTTLAPSATAPRDHTP